MCFLSPWCGYLSHTSPLFPLLYFTTFHLLILPTLHPHTLLLQRSSKKEKKSKRSRRKIVEWVETHTWCGHATYFSKIARKENGAREVENGMGRMNGRKVDELIRAQLAFFRMVFISARNKHLVHAFSCNAYQVHIVSF